jgi:hypothetical protein
VDNSCIYLPPFFIIYSKDIKQSKEICARFYKKWQIGNLIKIKTGILPIIDPALKKAFDKLISKALIKFILVGKGGFEPPTSCSRSMRANQTALLPVDY